MKTPYWKNAASLFLMVMAITSCSKEAGEQGIQGSQGIPGEQGIQGAQGIQGEQGDTGTANVMYSDWIPQDWNFSDGTTYKSMLVEDPNLNLDFLANGGFVLGFFRYQDNVPYTLPYQSFSRNTIRSFTPVHFSEGGNVRFNIGSTDDTALTDDDVNGVGAGISAEYKYVLIPGGVPLTTGKGGAVAWEKLSYAEVCKALHIPE
tara:strand:- start:6080 stop:6691 length:612 start_codon:yes stop_codon:yes gene_type:complete